MCAAKITTRIKGHYDYQHNHRVGEQFECEREPTNLHSNNDIAVKNVNKPRVGHVSEALTEKLLSLIKSWKIGTVATIITGKEKRAPKGTWVFGGGIKLP